jgi:DNA-binding NarL/FixJ family response regulator
LAWSFQNEAGYDVAIVDLLLRDGSGFAVLQHLGKYQPGHVIVLSDFVTPAIADRCKKLGAHAAFRKSEIADCFQHLRSIANRLPPDATNRGPR